jgi:hydrogenase maturation protein HypF
MAEFAMCPKCKAQYTDVADRRFHAQPVACSHCGPKISLTDHTDKTIETDPDKAIAKTAELLLDGKIVAIKGVGGFHLAVDALNDQAVKRLRLRKRRDHKPFAMMAAAVEKIKEFALLDTNAEKILKSPQSPIVLLEQDQPGRIAPSVAAGVNTFAFMLCYAPLHHLLFAEKGIEVLVMTSANLSDEPLICKNQIALEKLGSVADAFLIGDRVIHRQLDDSVVHFIHDNVAFLRRARGYVPAPVIMKKPSQRDIFAAGADLKNTFCFVRQNQFIVSEHIGDLEDAGVYRHYVSSVPRLQKLFEASPRVAVCDLHPGYLSTQYARSLKAEKLITVQHHWAHIASVLAEHDYHDPVIGLVADGTGFGTDSAVWGCECLIASLKEFERFGHLAYYPLPGADKASKESIRPLLGLLRACSDGDLLEKYAWLLEPIEPDTKKLKVILDQLDKNLNTAQTSSLGRLFDAVAAILGLGSYNHFEAQLPMALEAVVDENINQTYDFQMISDSEKTIRLDFRNIIDGILHDVKNDILPGVISAKFHNTLAGAFMDFAARAKDKYGLNTVALSGGVFCNRYLSDLLITLLKEDGFSVLFNRLVPANDGGIALGQAAIAVENIRNL